MLQFGYYSSVLYDSINVSFFIGTNAMASKSKKKIIIAKKLIARKCKPPKQSPVNARKCVSQRAPCSDEQCPMRLILFLTNNNQWYLHGAAGFPTKTSWLKAFCKGNYLSWPLINVKNIAKYFPESEETQK